jgi:hypothetical protein
LDTASHLSPSGLHATKPASSHSHKEEEQVQLAIALSLSECERATTLQKSSTKEVLVSSTQQSEKETDPHQQDISLQVGEVCLFENRDLMDYEQKLDRLLQDLREFEISSDYTSPRFHLKDHELQKLYSDCLKHRIELMQCLSKYKKKMDELVRLSSLFLDARIIYKDICRTDEAREKIQF